VWTRFPHRSQYLPRVRARENNECRHGDPEYDSLETAPTSQPHALETEHSPRRSVAVLRFAERKITANAPTREKTLHKPASCMNRSGIYHATAQPPGVVMQ
jgi:hypothetical protein